jgi:hypothetical protein
MFLTSAHKIIFTLETIHGQINIITNVTKKTKEIFIENKEYFWPMTLYGFKFKSMPICSKSTCFEA